MAIDLARIESLTTELVVSTNQFLDAVRLLNIGTVQGEPLTTTQKTNIRNKARTSLLGVQTMIAAIQGELNA